jgi:hypothetical protein
MRGGIPVVAHVSPVTRPTTTPGIIHLTVMLCIRFPQSRRNVVDLAQEGGIEVFHETGRRTWQTARPGQA